MKHTTIEKADLKAKSEELQIPFSKLLAGYVLEELMYLIEDSPFSLFLWLKNSSILGVEQYRKKNVLTLEFAYMTDTLAMKKEGIVPGQKLSLKMGYVILAYILKKEKVPEISWKGRASLNGDAVELEISGEFAEMTIPVYIRITEMKEENAVPVKREFQLFMGKERTVPYLEYPAEDILTEELFAVLKNMELLPQMNSYDNIFHILTENPVDGRHIKEKLSLLCEKENLVPEMERVETILGYRDYTYMRKRWEKYLRHQKRMEPSWDEMMEQLSRFLPGIWSSICKDEVFFGDWMPGLGRFLD